jgi:hypothetical protein
MCMNGVTIGSERTKIPRNKIRVGRNRARTVCVAAVAGSTIRRVAALLIGAMGVRRIATTISAFAWPAVRKFAGPGLVVSKCEVLRRNGARRSEGRTPTA